MPEIKPFRAIRPKANLAKDVSCLPYDVMNTQEARKMAEGNNVSFLRVIRSEIDLDENVDVHSAPVYERAAQNLNDFIAGGILKREDKDCFYVYEETMNGRVQIGIAGLCDVDDYKEDRIKKHEHTFPEKETDRINHFLACQAQTEPVFFVHKTNEALSEVVGRITLRPAEYDFESGDGVRHRLWVVADEKEIGEISSIMNAMDAFYIADGHHRTASAAKVAAKMDADKGVSGKHYIMSVIFPQESIYIMDYNRLLHDTGEYSAQQFIEKIKEDFDVVLKGKEMYAPTKKHEFSMYIESNWYALKAKDGTYPAQDAVLSLDASILQNNVFGKILGIEDPRSTKRLSFVGGIRGLGYLREQVDSGGAKAAFALCAVDISDLLRVADNRDVMPPKSTWFEPKLRSGLFIYSYKN